MSDPLAHPDEPQRALTGDEAPLPALETPAAHALAPRAPSTLSAVRTLWILASALFVVLLGYLAFAVPASWFPSSPPLEWSARDMTMPRGTGAVVNNELVVTGTDAAGQVYIAVVTDLKARDYATITWHARNVPADAKVHFLWRSDYAPKKIFSIPVVVEAGRLQPVVLAKDPGWLGHVTGIGLAMRGNLQQQFAISGVAAKPSGAFSVLQDRAGEWLAFERWNGTSINAVTGGDDVQSLPLPLLLAASMAVALAAMWAWQRYRPATDAVNIATAIAVMFVTCWLVLDARWTWNLARQIQATAAQYGHKDWVAKHMAAEDAALFDFVQRARAEMPATPARIFIASEPDYFRERAAYHFYPHNVFAEPRRNELPPASSMKPGDWMLVFQRRGVQFDPAAGKLRWDGGEPVSAQLKLRVEGGALFLIQ
ncbi:MAG: hypothetical protein ABI607_08745 [Betaproteobacteria bacterium]